MPNAALTPHGTHSRAVSVDWPQTCRCVRVRRRLVLVSPRNAAFDLKPGSLREASGRHRDRYASCDGSYMSEAVELALAADDAPRAPRPDERPRLHAWLDRGLRRGEVGRLAAEYPLSMGPGGSLRHQVVYDSGAPVAHAMSHVVRVLAGRRALVVGMIGNVYTDPSRRGRGFAARCIEAALADLGRSGAALAVLWSEERDLYTRLGFRPAGVERFWRLCAAPLGADERFDVRAAAPADFAQLERLHAAKPVRVDRAPGALGRLAAAPETRVVVASSAGEVYAYAASGRGDDFQGVVHEWAGEPVAVASCIEHLRSRHGAASVLAGPEDEGLGAVLAARGAELAVGVFALARILDAGAIWRSVGGERGGHLGFRQAGSEITLHTRRDHRLLPPELANALFFGNPRFDSVALPRPDRRLLARRLPWPLYVWGFDSI